MSDKIFKLAEMEEILKKAGATRVSHDACEALRDMLEVEALKIGDKAKRFAEHAGRVTVKGVDITMLKNLPKDE